MLRLLVKSMTLVCSYVGLEAILTYGSKHFQPSWIVLAGVVVGAHGLAAELIGQVHRNRQARISPGTWYAHGKAQAPHGHGQHWWQVASGRLDRCTFPECHAERRYSRHRLQQVREIHESIERTA